MSRKSTFLILSFLFLFTSCEKEEEPTPVEESGAFSEGILILNEGNFGSGNSSVSHLDPELETIMNNIYQAQNSGQALGDTATDLAFHKEQIFIVVNASNKVVVVDADTFEVVSTIETGLEYPRKITFLDGLAYVTNWGEGSNPDDDFVSVFDAESLELLTEIPTAEGPDEILAAEEQIFVAHSGGWSFNNIVSVIDPIEQTVVSEIEVGDVPNSLIAENGNLWVLSSGLPAYSGEETAGELTKINLASLEVSEEFEFESSAAHPSNLVFDNGNFFYALNGNIYGFDSAEANLPHERLFALPEDGVLYGLNAANGNIFAAFATPDFTGNGELIVYGYSGAEVASFETGINPNGVYFIP